MSRTATNAAVFLLVLFLAGLVSAAEFSILQGLAFGTGEDRLAIAEEGDGGFFAAGFVYQGNDAVVRVVHVRPFTEFPWGTGGLTGATFHGFFVQGDLAAVADGQGGVYVAAAARDLSFVPRLVVGHFSASQQYTELYSSTDPSFGNTFEVEAVSDGAGGIVVVGALDPPSGHFFSLRLHHADTGSPQPITWGVTQHDDDFWIAGNGWGRVLLVHGNEYEVRAQLLASDDSFPWGNAGAPINIQTGSPVLDRRCVYEPSAGIFHVIWTEADGECFGRVLGSDGTPWADDEGPIVAATVTGSPESLGMDLEVVGDGSILVGYGQAELVVQRISEEVVPMWAEANRWVPGDPAPSGSVFNDLTLLTDHDQFHWTARLGVDPERVTAGLWGRLADGGFSGAVNDVQEMGDPGFERPRRIYGGVHHTDTYLTIRTSASNHVEIATGDPNAQWILPATGEQGTVIDVEVRGNYLHPSHVFSLVGPGQPEIPLQNPTYAGTPTTGLFLRMSADLAGATLGNRDLVVRSSVDGSVLDLIADGFEIVPRVTAVSPPTLPRHSLTAFPNPANPMTTIRFDLPTADLVSLFLHDAAGRLVRRLVTAEPLASGFHEIPWNGRNHAGGEVASGVYLVRLVTEAGEARTTRVTLVR